MPGGDLWFTDYSKGGAGTGSIGRITPSGVITMFSGGPLAGTDPTALVPGPGGELWFSGQTNNLTWIMGRITEAGAITLIHSGFPSRFGTGVVFGPGGVVWLIGYDPVNLSGAIERITPMRTSSLFSHGLPTLWYPTGFVLGPGGNLWFSEASGNLAMGPGNGLAAIGRVTSSGVITLFTKGLPPGSEPDNLMVGPGGSLWFLDQSANGPGAIGRIIP